VQGAAEQEFAPLVSSEKDVFWILVAVVVILSAVFAYIIISGKRSEQHEAEMRFKESEHRQGYLDQVKRVISDREEK
jgi:heme/copper-type cytochrome/quinol oxidase subunit 2